MAQNPLPNVEIEESEIIDFDTQDITKGVRVKLKDGSILEVMLDVTAVTKIGHDINTGMPVYNVNSSTIIKTKYIPKELMKKTKNTKPQGYQ